MATFAVATTHIQSPSKRQKVIDTPEAVLAQI